KGQSSSNGNSGSSGSGSTGSNSKQKGRNNKIEGLENIKYEGLPLPLIMDGKVQDQNLELIGKTRFWLKNQIQHKGIMEFKDVFICSIDHNGKIYVSSKDDKDK
ncbi:DUF421 domain-containing protein, partial [Salmonella enterica]|nr:DUF421 domain-containing protein [Salmonella enterica]